MSSLKVATSLIALSLLISHPAYTTSTELSSIELPQLKKYDYLSRDLLDLNELEILEEQPIEEEPIEEIQETIALPVYRQTYYSVEEGELSVGALYDYDDPEMKIIDNVIHYLDKDYGYLPVIAINIDEVIASGQNSKGVWNIYGSVVELTYPDNQQKKAIVLDACGECSRASKIDLWVYENQQRHDISDVTLRYIRYGWSEYLESIY